MTSSHSDDMMVTAVVFLWMSVQPTKQAAFTEATNAACPDNCNHHGDCHVVKSVNHCDCHFGWGGDFCEIPCSRPCVHGMCVFAGSKQLCLCTSGYTGDLCQEPGFDLAALLNLAKVISANTAYSLPLVVDPAKEVQANIERKSNTCMSNFVCQNGGRCVNGIVGGYRCQCDPSAVTGHFCQYICPKPCLNGGTCVRLRRSESKINVSEVISLPEAEAVYRCICADGFAGERCGRSMKPLIKITSASGT